MHLNQGKRGGRSFFMGSVRIDVNREKLFYTFLEIFYKMVMEILQRR